MARADLRVIGPQGDIMRRIAVATTAIQAGEPVDNQATSSSGAASANVYALSNADGPIIGTDRFGGVAVKNALLTTGLTTTQAQELPCACPIPEIGRIAGKAEVAGNVDTESELINVTGDFVLFDENSTGASDGGELFTIKSAASADSSGLEIVGGNFRISELEVMVASAAYRFTVS